MSDIQQAGEALQAAGELAQKKILERWVSSTLEPRELACTDLFEDMKDGWLLFNLLEVLSDSDLRSIGKWSKGRMRIQIVANMNIVFKYLKSAIKLNNIGPTDVVDGNVKLVLALLWMIMGHFATAELEAGGVDIKTLKRRLQHWLLAYSVAPQNSSAFDPQGEAPFPVPNLNRALQDGQVLLAVLHHFNPGECPPAQERVTGTPVKDLEVALDEMATLHGVEKLLDPGAKLEDKYTLPYLVQMVGKLHEKFGSSADEGSCRPLSDPTLDEPPASDPSAQALKASQADLAAQAASKEAAEENLKGMTAKVKELELDKEKLESLVGQLEDELMKSKEELAGANTLARKASVVAMGSPPASLTGAGGSVPPVPSSPPPPPPPNTSVPPPVPTSVPPPPPSPSPEGAGENGTCSVCGGNLDSRLEMMEQQHKEALEIALAGAEERFSEIETRHVARADDLEARLLAAERDRAAESSRHLKAIQELSAQLEAAKLEAETSSSERDELAASVEAEREVMAKRVQDQDAERRKLHNTIQDLRGNVRVFARVRPFLPHEQPKLRSGEEPWLRVDADGTTVHALASSSADKDSAATGPYNPDEVEVTHSFSFDRTFGCEDGQETVFVEVSEFVQSALDGYNVCLFSYGQTGSGKTHTMTGFPDGPERGIIPRAIEQVAKRKGQLEEAGWSFEMEISFIEIYCEQIKDLLSTEDPSDAAGGSGGGSSNKTKYKIIQNEFGQNVVTNVEMVPVDPSDTGSIAELMQHAASLRSVTATKMNAESSRSHSVFTLHMTAEHAKQGITLHGQLNLVDLAGSERVEKSGVSGQALTEAKHINTSLSALAGVFLALGKKNSHVPFRDSKLTELLHPALSANGKTLMMLNLSPQETSISESISSLRFGTNVNSCELGKAKRVIKRKEKERGTSPGASSRSRSTTSPPQVRHGGRERSRSPNRDRENSPVRRSSMGTRGVGGRGAASPAGRGGGRTPPPGRPQARRSITKEKESPAKN